MPDRHTPDAAPAAGPNRWFFDLWSLVYDLPVVQWATYRPVHDAVVGALGRTNPRRVLDIGCGTGQLATRLHRELRQVEIVGCDFSAGMLGRAATRSRRVRWVRGDAGRLPFDDESFDAVVSTEAFHWFPDQAAALREIYRVLKPGGRLLLALVNTPSTTVSRAVQTASRLVGEPFYWPSVDQMRRRVEAAGFRVAGQRRVFRVAGMVLFPPILTDAVRPQRRR